MKTPLASYALLILLAPAFSGCLSFSSPDACWQDAVPEAEAVTRNTSDIDFDANSQTLYADMGFDGTTWPSLEGKSLTILDHGAFEFAFDAAQELFTELTGATVTHVGADDAGTALQLAMQDQEAGGGSFDVIYGIDNSLMTKAIAGDIFESYTPYTADRIEPRFRFVPTDDEGAWMATPVDRGYIAVNIDPRANVTAESMNDLVGLADQFVTEDPRFSSPGLGFLLATVATYGEDCYLGYWDALFENGVTVTSGWTEAYVDRFSGGYGQWNDGSRSDKPIVTSYTSSPAYEVYYGSEILNDNLLAPESVFEQIQTMGILNGTENRIVAEAWIEFTLSDAFQALAAPNNAIYPVVDTPLSRQSVKDVYGNNDPYPRDLVVANLDYETIGTGVEGWVQDWADLYDLHRA